MTTSLDYEASTREENNHSIEDWDHKIRNLTAQIERIKLDKKAAEEALAVETNRLRLKESELRRVKGLKEARKIERIAQVDDSLQLVRTQSRRRGELTPYKIRGYGSQRGQKKNLHIGDIVFTNKGTGAYAGLNRAQVKAPLDDGYVQLKFEGVHRLTHRLAINLQHTEFREE